MTQDHTTKLTSFMVWFGFLGLVVGTLTCTAPGRMLFCDDEVMFQTAQSIWEDGDFSIAGIPIRTGERPGRATGSFGVDGPAGYQADGVRYGFFGVMPSLLALPMLAMADATQGRAPSEWSHAIRRDLVVYHRPSQERRPREDWQRLWVAWTNTWITSAGAACLLLLLMRVGYDRSTALIVSLLSVFGTYAWWYAGSFLSEPTSTLCFLAAALGIQRFHRQHHVPSLLIAALVGGLSVHAHLLNLWCLPVLSAYALLPALRTGELQRHRGSFWLAAALMCLGPVLLAVLQWHHFGSPLESGRRDNYAVWILPHRSLVALFTSPGRGLLWFAPAATIGLLAALVHGADKRARVATFKRRIHSTDATLGAEVDTAVISPRSSMPDEREAAQRRDLLLLGVGLVLVRALFMAARSDWHGGWSLGPRYLLPAVPFLMVPLASAIERGRGLSLPPRLLLWVSLLASILASALLAVHSSYERMWRLMRLHGTESYSSIANGDWSASPWALYWAYDRDILLGRDPATQAMSHSLSLRIRALHLDALSHGSYKLAARGHPELSRIFFAFALLAVLSALCLVAGLWRDGVARAALRQVPAKTPP